jgi:hypothetical protein
MVVVFVVAWSLTGTGLEGVDPGHVLFAGGGYSKDDDSRLSTSGPSYTSLRGRRNLIFPLCQDNPPSYTIGPEQHDRDDTNERGEENGD